MLDTSQQDNIQKKEKLPKVDKQMVCQKCDSTNYIKWVEGDPHCMTHKAKCKECNYIWITAQYF